MLWWWWGLIELNVLSHVVISEQKVEGGDPAVHATKAYVGSRGLAPLIRNLGTIFRGWVVNITPRPFHLRERTLISFEHEAGWALHPVWNLRKREKSHAPSRDTNPDRTLRSVVAVSTALHWLLISKWRIGKDWKRTAVVRIVSFLRINETVGTAVCFHGGKTTGTWSW